MFHRQKGFTLIELLVVLAVIALLASVLLQSLNAGRSKGRDAKRLSDAKQIMLALEFYFDENGSYPVEDASTNNLNDIESDLVPGYLSELPTDPSFTGAGVYRYGTLGTENPDPRGYSLRIRLENCDGTPPCDCKFGVPDPDDGNYPNLPQWADDDDTPYCSSL